MRVCGVYLIQIFLLLIDQQGLLVLSWDSPFKHLSMQKPAVGRGGGGRNNASPAHHHSSFPADPWLFHCKDDVTVNLIHGVCFMLLTFELQWSNARSTSRPPLVRKAMQPEAEFLDKTQTRVLWIFFLVIHSHLYSFAWDFFFFKLAQPLTVSTVHTVHWKGKRGKTWQKTKHSSLWFKKSIKKPQVWELSRLCPETSTWLYIHEFRFWRNRLIIYVDLVTSPLVLSLWAGGPSAQADGAGRVSRALHEKQLIRDQLTETMVMNRSKNWF